MGQSAKSVASVEDAAGMVNHAGERNPMSKMKLCSLPQTKSDIQAEYAQDPAYEGLSGADVSLLYLLEEGAGIYDLLTPIEKMLLTIINKIALNIHKKEN